MHSSNFIDSRDSSVNGEYGVLSYYFHGQHEIMSGRSVNLTTLFLGRLRHPKRLKSTSCTYFRQ